MYTWNVHNLWITTLKILKTTSDMHANSQDGTINTYIQSVS